MSDERFRDSKLADSHLRDSRDRDSQAGNPQERDSQFSDSPFYDSFDEVAPGHTFLDSKEVVLNMGPQHPSTHGVLQVVLKLDGEKVNGLECIVGYLHRGIEKIAENRTWAQFGPFVDRLDYTAAVSNSLGYCLGVEKLLAAEVPKRGQYLRVILTELCRLASHQVWLGTHVLDIGAVTPLFYAFRDREMILNIFEKYCGARLTTHAFRIGGCRWDAYPDMAREVLHICDDLGPKIDEYRDLITGNRIWLQRTKGVGYISPEDCIAYAITGPVLRGSGISWDVRKAQPYSSYEDFDFDVPLGKN